MPVVNAGEGNAVAKSKVTAKPKKIVAPVEIPSDDEIVSDDEAETVEEAVVGKKKKASGEKKKRARKPRDPDAPKRAPSAFFLFTQANRQDIVQSLNDAGQSSKPANVSSEAGRQWNAAPADVRKPFEDRAAIAREAYFASKATYEASRAERALNGDANGASDDETNMLVDGEDESKKEKKKRPRKPVDPNAPQPSRNAFFLFKESLAHDLMQSFTDPKEASQFPKLIKEARQKWKDATPDIRKPFEERAAVEREAYLAAKKKYEASRPETVANGEEEETEAEMLPPVTKKVKKANEAAVTIVPSSKTSLSTSKQAVCKLNIYINEDEPAVIEVPVNTSSIQLRQRIAKIASREHAGKRMTSLRAVVDLWDSVDLVHMPDKVLIEALFE